MIVWPAVVPPATGSHERYQLHEPDDADAERLHSLFSSEAVTRYIPVPPSSLTAWRAWIAGTRRPTEGGGLAAFAVLKRSSGGEVAGLLQIATCPDEPGALMWGLVLAEPFWGTGLFGATARVVVDVARSQLHATALKAWIASDNQRAVRAFYKLRGVVVTRVPDTLCPDGRRGDFVIASIAL